MQLIIEKINDTAKLPTRAHANDAGLDLYSSETIILKPLERSFISTGVKLAIPENYVGLVWDKSGLAVSGLHTLAGVIDAGYRGEIKIGLINLGKEDYTINAGQKIAQLLVQPIVCPEITEGKVDTETTRGEGGFGSTGLQ